MMLLKSNSNITRFPTSPPANESAETMVKMTASRYSECLPGVNTKIRLVKYAKKLIGTKAQTSTTVMLR